MRQKFEHAAGAGAEIEHGVERRRADEIGNCRLDPLFRDMQRAQLVPIGGMGGKIACRLFGACAPHLGEPDTVGGARFVVGGKPSENVARERRRRAARGDEEKDPGPLAMALDEAGFDQQFQMPGNARLRLAENGDELGDGQLGLGEQRDEAQARRLRRRGKGGQQGFEGGGCWALGMVRLIGLPNYI